MMLGYLSFERQMGNHGIEKNQSKASTASSLSATKIDLKTQPICMLGQNAAIVFMSFFGDTSD